MSISRIDQREDFYSISKIRKIKEEIESLKNMKIEAQTYQSKNITLQADIDKKIRKRKASLEYYEPPQIKGLEKDKLMKEKKALEEKLKEVTLTDNEEWADKGLFKEKAVEKCLLRMSPFYEEMARKLRRINRMLEPHNPNYNTLHYLRRQT